MLAALQSNLAAWLGDLWAWLIGQRHLMIATLARSNRELRHKTETLSDMLAWTEADRRAMRDSITEHMANELAQGDEISSLRRHLNMAIEQRDQARKRKARTKK